MGTQMDLHSGVVASWIAAVGTWAVVAVVAWLAYRTSALIRALHDSEAQRTAASARTAAYFFFTDVASYRLKLELAQGVVAYALKNASMAQSEVLRLLKGRISLPSLTDNPAVTGQLPHGLTVQVANLAAEIRVANKAFDAFELMAALAPDDAMRESASAQAALQTMQDNFGALLQTVRTAEQSLSRFIYPEH
jgi:hypothetical protein